MDNYIMPTKIARAFKTIIKREKTQPADLRCSEFIRLGCTAYHYTLSYTDSFVLIHCWWPHKQDFGNAYEGWRTYFTRTEFVHTFCLTGAKQASYQMQESELPFSSDIIGRERLDHFFKLAEDRENRNPRQYKYVNAAYLHSVLGIFKALSLDGKIKLNIGTRVTGPISLQAYNPDMELELAAIVMPVIG